MAGGADTKSAEPEPYRPDTGRFSHDFLTDLANQHGTPLFVYDGDRIVKKFQKFKHAYEQAYGNVKVFYAVKANTNLSIVALLKQAGAYAECISLGEMKLAHRLGFRGEDILFTSSSKAPEELKWAVENEVIINLDSMGDLENLQTVVADMEKTARISFRINPDVDPNTHRHISTGHKFSKFGILFENDEIIRAYKQAAEDPHLEIWGIHSHIGSQITDLEPFERNVKLVVEAVTRLKKELGIELKFINLGGGLGIPYHDGQEPLQPETVAKVTVDMLRKHMKDLGYEPALWFEPGRYFVGDAGFLVTKVHSVKDTPYRHFINVDTGFNHLIRPVLYEAYHRVRVLNRSENLGVYDVAGNICETGDILAKDRQLPRPEKGDYMVFLDAGAYGFSMASEYNMFRLPAEVLVRGERVDIVRKRAEFDDFFRNQVVPTDLNP